MLCSLVTISEIRLNGSSPTMRLVRCRSGARKPADRSPRFHEAADPLRDQSGSRENRFQFMFAQQPKLLHQFSRSCRVRTRASPPASPAPNHCHSQRQRHPLPARNMKMRLHREPEVRSLDPVSFTNALDFRCHAPLIFESEQMLNDRVAESDIEAAVAELGEVGGIARDRLDVFVPLLLRDKIQTEYLDICPAGPAPIFPKFVFASNVEDTQGTRQRSNQCFEPPKSGSSHSVGKRVCVWSTGEPPQRWNRAFLHFFMKYSAEVSCMNVPALCRPVSAGGPRDALLIRLCSLLYSRRESRGRLWSAGSISIPIRGTRDGAGRNPIFAIDGRRWLPSVPVGPAGAGSES